MSSHISFLKSKIHRSLKTLQTEIASKKSSYGNAKLLACRPEIVLAGGIKRTIHRLFVDTEDSGVYKALGWVIDQDIDACMICNRNFGLAAFKHHCRACGNIVCNPCSPYMTAVHELPNENPTRVCKQCFYDQEVVYAVIESPRFIPPVRNLSFNSTSSKRNSYSKPHEENRPSDVDVSRIQNVRPFEGGSNLDDFGIGGVYDRPSESKPKSFSGEFLPIAGASS